MPEQKRVGTKHRCKRCRKVFYAYRKNRSYCSPECYNLSREIPMKPCLICGKEFLARTKRKGERQKYCSVQCLGLAHRRENHPNWTGGRGIDSSGYVLVNLGDGQRVREHRIIAEEILGRTLESREIINHINGDKTDNRPDNLAVLTKVEHGSHNIMSYRCPQCGYCGYPLLAEVVQSTEIPLGEDPAGGQTA